MPTNFERLKTTHDHYFPEKKVLQRRKRQLRPQFEMCLMQQTPLHDSCAPMSAFLPLRCVCEREQHRSSPTRSAQQTSASYVSLEHVPYLHGALYMPHAWLGIQRRRVCSVAVAHRRRCCSYCFVFFCCSSKHLPHRSPMRDDLSFCLFKMK